MTATPTISSPTWDSTTRTLRLSGSSLNQWQRCPYRWWAANILRRVRPGITSVPALFGQAFHAALSNLARGQSVEVARASLLGCYAGVKLPQDEWMTPGRCSATLDSYLPTWISDAWETARDTRGAPVVEWPFCFELGSVAGATILWSGYVDFAVQATINGRLQRVVVDHKTTQRASALDLLLARYEMSRSILGYLVALETLGLGEFDGALVNEVVVRAPVQKVTAKTKPQFEAGEGHRLFIPFSDSRKGRWRSEVLDLAARIVGQLDEGTFPRHEVSCAFPSICPYHEACTMETEPECLDFLQSEEYVTKQSRVELEAADPEPVA